jgi:glycerophosphoryl diester phosphodiesterase
MLIIGHRGASGRSVENTLAAFELAMELGVSAIEFDLQIADDELYVFHDIRLERLTGVKGQFKKLSQAQVAALTINGSHKIPTLEQVLNRCAGKLLINLEIKAPNATALLCERLPQLYESLADKLGIAYEQLIKQLIISSFDYQALQQVQAKLPEVQLAFLTKNFTEQTIDEAKAINAIAINMLAARITPEVVSQIHGSNLKCFAFTVNKDRQLKKLVLAKVDGIFSDYPESFLSHQSADDLAW